MQTPHSQNTFTTYLVTALCEDMLPHDAADERLITAMWLVGQQVRGRVLRRQCCIASIQSSISTRLTQAKSPHLQARFELTVVTGRLASITDTQGTILRHDNLESFLALATANTELKRQMTIWRRSLT